jgi:ATP-binding protein involved in chromosome partitioning
MSVITETIVLDALRNVQEPELGRDIVTLDMVKSIAIDGADVAFTI